MNGFLDTLRNPFALIVFVFVAGSFLRALMYQWNVRRNGYETEATVTSIVEREIYRDGHPTYYDDVHVVYQTKDGRFAEGSLANVTRTFTEGERIRIKYTDEDPDNPVYTGKAK